MGFDFGMNTSGGFGEYISVPSRWAAKVPQVCHCATAWVMALPALTAALCLLRLMAGGLNKDSGEVLVTGATGGVGSIAVAILAKLGFNVVAATGKANEKDFLTQLGAKRSSRAKRPTIPRAGRCKKGVGPGRRHGGRKHSRHGAQEREIRRLGGGLRQRDVRRSKRQRISIYSPRR